MVNKYLRKYEGAKVEYRGICDEINRIVMFIISNLHQDDWKVNRFLCISLSGYDFIESIYIDENWCSINFYDNGKIRSIKFRCYYFGDEYKKMCYTKEELINSGDNVNELLGSYKLSGKCHSASLNYLEAYKNKNIKAVTSICNSWQNYSFFHSYIWDCDSNLVYDLARNLVMDKDDYDYLFTLKEINCLSYNEFLLYNNAFPSKKYNELLNLAFVTLNNDKCFYRKIF